MKCIYGYIKNQPHGAIHVCTEEPDYSMLKDVEYDWMYSVYGNVCELIPADAPVPLGKAMVMTTYIDANLYHCLLTGCANTGILHLLNKTPIDWFTKHQSTVETATYGSKFVAACQAVNQIIDLCTSLHYLGVPIQTKAYMFGDNQSVVTSSTIPHSGLNKHHNALSYHHICEAIAAKILSFFHIDGKTNPADILSKHCGFQEFWPHIKALLFWPGDMASIADGVKKKVKVD